MLLPNNNQDYITAGTYYIAVVSEGQNPVSSSRIGTGDCSWTLESQGTMDINNLGTVTETDIIQADTLEGGATKAYQFTVPDGMQSLEVRLENTVGTPILKFVQGSRLPRVRYTSGSTTYDYYGNYGGQSSATYTTNLVALTNPATGVYSVIVNATDSANGTGAGSDASFNLRVRRHTIHELNFTSSQNGNGHSNSHTGQLANAQSDFLKVVVPAQIDGAPVLGWRLSLASLQGSAYMRVRCGALPDSSTSTTPFKTGAILVTAPFLTPGTWYIEVNASGNTSYSIASQNFALDRPAWTMPQAGQPIATPGLESGPYFADTGTDVNGNPLPGDHGVDLDNGCYHYYAVTVPADNAVLIRTMLEAISGNPDLYIRLANPPTLDHNSTGQSGSLYDRSLTGTGTEYANWVPLDGKITPYLPGGTWYLAVRAAGSSNSRYRLRMSAGDVQELSLNGGSLTNQTLAANDWRYYKVSVPWDAPANWNVAFAQHLGDVVMYMRDTSPPGNTTNSTSYVDWGSISPSYLDSKNNGPYASYDLAGTYTFNVPPVRPGHTYYIGFRAINDSTFSVSSSTNGGSFASPTVVSFYGGSVSTTIPANSSLVFRFDVPADAGRWLLSNTHASSVSVYMEQGTMPKLDSTADWRVTSSTNSSFDRSFVTSTSWPWRPGYSYYMVAVNTSASPQTFTTTSTGYSYAADLGLTMTDSPDPLLVDSNITYTITLSNKVAVAAKNVVVTDNLPPNVTFVSATSTVGTCTGSGPVICTIPTLNQGATATITIVAKANAAGTLTNTASVVSDMPERNPADNSVSTDTTVVSLQGGGTTADPYLIATPEDLYCIRYQLGKCFRQVADINLGVAPWNTGTGWLPIGTYSGSPFAGTYDGNGYAIAGLTINRPTTDYIGLYAYTSGAQLTDVHLTQMSVVGQDQTGGLVGRQNGGNVTSCMASGSVTGRNYIGGLDGYASSNAAISGSGAAATVQGTAYAGGLVGYSTASSISCSFANGSVSVTSNYAGGLVAYSGSSSSLTNCYAAGSVASPSGYAGGLVAYNVSPSTVTKAYSCGNVTGAGSYIGGLIGRNTGTVNQSYWDTVTSGQAASAGGTPKTTAQMKQQATFANWDFNTIWETEEGVTYPHFQYERVYDAVDVCSAKLSQDERPVLLTGAIVSAAWNDFFYVETDDRAAGIRVEKASHGLTDANARATVKGVVKTSVDGERYIKAFVAYSDGTGTVDPLGIPLKSLGGGALYDPISGFGQIGVSQGIGLNNVGLLVRVWGRVVDVEPVTPPTQPTWFKIDDGSGIAVKCVVPDGVTIDQNWTYVSVTGVSSCEKIGDEVHRLLRVRTQESIQVY